MSKPLSLDDFNHLEDLHLKILLNGVVKSQILVSNSSSSWSAQNLQVKDHKGKYNQLTTHHENTPVRPSVKL